MTDPAAPRSPLELVAPLAVDEAIGPAGVATFATQSGGCERAGKMGDVPLVLYHGDTDRILGPENSHMVQMIAGRGDVHILRGADHLLVEAAQEIREHFYPWLDSCFN